MSYNGSGTFQINTTGQPVVAGTVISSTAFNALTADLATGLSTAITKDGQTATTVRIPFAAGISSTLVTDSSSVSTGSIITAGGVGIAKALYVGTTANIAGVATFSAGTAALPAITTTGDTNTGIFFPVADTIAFTEGGAEAMRIDSSGNVGIGTSSPAIKLDVNGNIALPNATALQFKDGGGTRKDTLQLNASSNVILQSPSASIFQINGSTEGMRINSSGNLLVNTTTNVAAGAKIFAVGSGQGIAVGYGTGSSEYRHLYMNNADATLYFFNDTNFASLNAAGAWTNASDARLKKNIVDIKYGLSDVLKLQPRSYQMNSVAGDFVGFVAQELKEVVPEVVSGDPEIQLGVDYGSLVAVAFKAIQEQQALITSLTTRITALEAK
jgi:hypothetical protein